MAAVTGGQLEVRFSLVALAAERNNLPVCGRMPIVAILAADLRLVLAPCLRNVGRCFVVALDAVVIR